MPGGHHTLHRGHRRLSSAIAFLLAMVALFALDPSAAASSPGTISVSPSPLSVSAGDTIFVSVDVTGVSNVHAMEFTLGYDPSVVQVNDADVSAPWTQILPGPFPGSASEGTVVHNSAAAGVIDYEYMLNTGLTRSGAGTVATVQFTALANGDANLTWLAASVVDGAGVRMTPSAAPPQLVVGAPAAAATVAAVATDTPLAPTSSAVPQSTATDPAPTATDPAATDTTVATVTRTPAPTKTPAPPKATPTPRASKTAAVGGLSHVPAPGQGNPAQVKGTHDLPVAGAGDDGIAWWRWIFFLAAILFGISSWFYTFALHQGQKQVILVDKFTRRRYRR